MAVELLPNTIDHTVIDRYVVQPADVGATGFVHGATLLEWVHRAGHSVATRWSGGSCVAASVGNIHLDRPIGVGESVNVHADLVYTGRSSMHILVTICCGQTAQCAIVFVAVDESHRPVDVLPWTPITMLELQRQRQARVRIMTRRRVEAALAAESATTAGTAPRATLRHRATGAESGGRVMRWIDEAACRCAADWIAAPAISSYVAGVRFHRPVGAGEAVEVTARIIHTGPRSVHTDIHVTATDGGLVAHGVVVLVALDVHGGARAVPQWEPDSGEDRRLDRFARNLIELRQYIEPFTVCGLCKEPHRNPESASHGGADLT